MLHIIHVEGIVRIFLFLPFINVFLCARDSTVNKKIPIHKEHTFSWLRQTKFYAVS